MLRTKQLISQLSEVPRTWVFEHYLELTERLTGQDVKIKSCFNSTDKTPSMNLHCSRDGVYGFHDFSTGKSGDSVTLVKELYGLLTKGEAAHKIMSDYNQYLLTNPDDKGVREFKVQARYKVTNFTTRAWNNLDEKYWMKFHIGSKLLEKYCVFPLEGYKMAKEEEEEVKELEVKGHYLYGFFRSDGVLYKIYQPMVKDLKFIKVRNYIQGTDQLTMKEPYLVICSSLKDVMAFRKLGFKNVEAIAPDSENTLIQDHNIQSYKHKYKGIITLFDNDAAGLVAMQKYKDKYDLEGIQLELSKDLSDSIRDHGLTKVREILTPLLKEKLIKTLIPHESD